MMEYIILGEGKILSVCLERERIYKYIYTYTHNKCVCMSYIHMYKIFTCIIQRAKKKNKEWKRDRRAVGYIFW